MDVEQLEQLAAVIVTAGLVAGNFLLFTPWRDGHDPRQRHPESSTPQNEGFIGLNRLVSQADQPWFFTSSKEGEPREISQSSERLQVLTSYGSQTALLSTTSQLTRIPDLGESLRLRAPSKEGEATG